MAEPTAADVRAIAPHLSLHLDLQPFITLAQIMIDQYRAQALWADDLTFELKRWAAAHYACTPNPLDKEYRAGDTAVKWQRGKDGTGYESTDYGKIVLKLDPTGILELATTTKPASVFVD